MLSKYFDILIPAESVLFTGLSNLGVIFHPVPIILNVARIECKETFSHYQEGITPTVASLLEKIDSERVEIASRLNIEVDSAVNWLNRIYKSEGETLYHALQNNPAYTEVLAPSTIHNRYIYEDIETGLVPLSAIAHKIGVKSYTIDAIINLANLLYDFDFVKHGRNESRIDLESIISQTEDINAVCMAD
jgi:opine dehydrogenase